MGPTERIVLTKEELRELIRTTVRESLSALGMESDDPNEMQQDFQHLREMRLMVTEVKRRGLFWLLGTLAAAIMGLLILGAREWFRKGG